MPLKSLFAKPLFHLLLIALTGILAYSNSFGVPFVYDDVTSIVENPVIRDLGSFLKGDGLGYNPRRFLTYLTLAINYRIGGLEVAGYHVFNLAVHLAVAALVYFFTLTTLKTPRLASSRLADRGAWLALTAALLFVAHPFHTEAVTYVIQRTTSLAALFYLLCVFMYARGRLEAQGGRSYLLFAAALASALAAMLCKEIAATLPLAVILYEISFFSASWRQRARLLWPCAALLSLVPLALLSAGRPLGELLSSADRLTRETAVISRSEYLLTQFRVIATYLRQLFFPYGQNIDYDYPLSTGFFTPPVLSSFFLLAVLLAVAGWLYTRSSRDVGWRLAGFGIFWFFIALLVESSLIPIRDVINEHRLYLPSIGIALSVAATLTLLLDSRPRLLGGLVSLAVFSLGLATWQRNAVWASELTLWRDAVKKSPGKGRVYHNYGKALSEAGQHAQAIVQYQMAIRRGTPTPDTYVNLGAEYDRVGQPHRAEEFYRLALEVDPSHATALTRLAIALLQKPGGEAEGISLLQKGVEIAPGNANLRFNLGAALEAQGDMAGAEEQYRQAIRIKPDYAKAHQRLGELLRQKP